MNGYHDLRVHARKVSDDILSLDLSNFGTEDTRSELRLNLLFKNL